MKDCWEKERVLPPTPAAVLDRQPWMLLVEMAMSLDSRLILLLICWWLRLLWLLFWLRLLRLFAFLIGVLLLLTVSMPRALLPVFAFCSKTPLIFCFRLSKCFWAVPFLELALVSLGAVVVPAL